MDKENLHENLDIIDDTPELTLFFKRLFEDINYYKLFFLHREEIFPVNEGSFLKYVFWNNVSPDSNNSFKILANQAELKSISSKSTQNSMKQDMFPSESIKLLQDPIMYSLIKFVRDNPKVLDLIKNQEFNYVEMKKILSDYSKLNLKILDDIGNAISGKQVDDSDFVKMITTLVIGFRGGFQNIVGNFGHYLPNMTDTLPAAFLTVHSNYYPHLDNLLNTANLSKIDYTELLADLHSQKNLNNLNTVFWCSNCIDENIILNSESSLNPNHQKLSCPRCSNILSASTVFELDDIIEEAIMDKDGLLQLATAWLLKANEIKFETNYSDDKFEYDFICNIPEHNMLIECKMHRMKHDERQLRLWIEDDLRQMQEHYEKIKDSQEIKHFVIVSNIDVNKNIALIQEIKKKYSDELWYANILALPDILKQVKPE